MKKRDFLAGAGGSLAAGALGAIAPGLARAAAPWQPGELAEGTVDSATLEALPGKVPLIKRSWQPAKLGRDYGPYSFRQYSDRFRPEKEGVYLVMVKATNARGDTQTMSLVHNPAGYHHNVVERIQVEVV